MLQTCMYFQATQFHHLVYYLVFVGVIQYRVTKESLMDRLSIDMHEACLKIDKECR
ncbi:hypothetical protein SLEP1_g24935 [Rubroshorea leprosula]|uniref:Uncharacterized protein n=1 Tax=Rubroshorea leprosula TaxID=152421 RepID=A0AAV5JTD6_9ROSI|nr:hypothetical protein SLEP1_g24935 [Rubroshorea leprosula]